jgi:tetratricopeptide (TPR) repeat protein
MSSRRLVLALVCLAGLAAVPRLAHADDVAEAREHFKRGRTLYYLQRYLEAAAEYEKTYELRDEPSMLFNIGQAYRLGGDQQKAIGAYRSYLSRFPAAPNRTEVAALIEDARKTLEAQKHTRERPPTGTLPGDTGERVYTAEPDPRIQQQHDKEQLQQREREQRDKDQREQQARAKAIPLVPSPATVDRPNGPPARTLKVAGIAVGGFGIASLALGAAFAALTADANQGLRPSQPAYYDADLYGRGVTFQTLYPVFFAVGGVALVTGAVLYAVGVKHGHATQLHSSIGNNGAGATVRWGF